TSRPRSGSSTRATVGSAASTSRKALPLAFFLDEGRPQRVAEVRPEGRRRRLRRPLLRRRRLGARGAPGLARRGGGTARLLLGRAPRDALDAEADPAPLVRDLDHLDRQLGADGELL